MSLINSSPLGNKISLPAKADGNLVLIISTALLPKQDPGETWQETLTLDSASQAWPQVEPLGWWPQEPQSMTRASDPPNLKAKETVT